MGQLDKVPESTVLPKCDVLAKIASLQKKKSGSGKLMYRAEFRIVDDGEKRFVNIPLFEQYVIGSDRDPDAENTKTWIEAPGSRNMKRLFKKLGLDTTKDVDDLIVEAEDQEIGLTLTRFTEPDTKKKRMPDGTIKEQSNEYAGQERNRISTYWTPGEKEPAIHEDADTDDDSTTTVAAKKAAAKKPAAATDEGDGEGEGEAATVAAKRPVGRPPKAAAAAAATDEGEGEGEGEAAAAPVAAKKPATGNGVTKPAAGKPKQLPCPTCDEMVDRGEFGAHIQQHVE